MSKAIKQNLIILGASLLLLVGIFYNLAIPEAKADNTYTYGVAMDSSNFALSGYAWSDNIGWISFSGNIVCGASSYSYSNWSPLTCTAPGTQTRSLTNTPSCSGGISPTLSQTCSCAPAVGTWSSCSASCGGGTQTRTNTNADCSSSVETGTCNTQACAVNPVPVISFIEPASKYVGDSTFTLFAYGSNFGSGTRVFFNGVELTVTSAGGHMEATFPSSMLTTAGTFNVTVSNPTPGGGISNAIPFVVNPANPVPSLSSVNPMNKAVGSVASTITVGGTNFISGSVVNFNGSPRTTTYVSATQLTATIPATDLTTVGTKNITVTNPAPGGGTSNPAVPFYVTSPSPVISSISPTMVLVGSPAFTLTVNGTNFFSGLRIMLNGSAVTTTFVDSTRLNANNIKTDGAGIYTVNVNQNFNGGINYGPSQTLIVYPVGACVWGDTFYTSGSICLSRAYDYGSVTVQGNRCTNGIWDIYYRSNPDNIIGPMPAYCDTTTPVNTLTPKCVNTGKTYYQGDWCAIKIASKTYNYYFCTNSSMSASGVLEPSFSPICGN